MFSSRIKRLQAEFPDQTVLIEDPIDLYYLTGLQLSLGSLIVEPQQATLFVDGRYIEAAQKVFPAKLLDHLFDKRYTSLVFDSEKTSVARLVALEKGFGKDLRPVGYLTRSLRMIKETGEIEKIKHSCMLVAKFMKQLEAKLRPGVQEKEIGIAFHQMALEQGIEKLSFDPIVAFGAHAAMPHYRTGSKILEAQECALLDLGTMYQGYCSDMTRTFFADPELYQLVQKAKEAAASLARPGEKLGVLDEAARAVFAQAGMLEHYLHSLGHGLGLEIHEAPRLKAGNAEHDLIIQKNMVVTIEPGLYVAGHGGVRLEDTYLITDSGAVALTV